MEKIEGMFAAMLGGSGPQEQAVQGWVRGHVSDGEEGIARMLGLIVLDQAGQNGLRGPHAAFS